MDTQKHDKYLVEALYCKTRKLVGSSPCPQGYRPKADQITTAILLACPKAIT